MTMSHVSVLPYLLVNLKNIYFELKLYVFVMHKAVANREICFIKAVLLSFDFVSLNFTSHVRYLLLNEEENVII